MGKEETTGNQAKEIIGVVIDYDVNSKVIEVEVTWSSQQVFCFWRHGYKNTPGLIKCTR